MGIRAGKARPSLLVPEPSQAPSASACCDAARCPPPYRLLVIMLIFRRNEFASIDDVALFILNVNLDLRTYGFGTGGGAACSTCGVAESVHVIFNCTRFFLVERESAFVFLYTRTHRAFSWLQRLEISFLGE